jgi:(2Fe-2S) ferredoxin
VAERRFRIIVCRGPECGDKRNATAVHEAFAAQIAAHGLAGRCQLDWQSCFGRCSQGPNVLVRELPDVAAPKPRFAGLADLPPSRGGGPRLATALYNRIDPVKVVEVVARHVIQGTVVGRFIERPELTAPQPQSTPPGESDV